MEKIVKTISKFETKTNKTIPLIAGGGIFTGEDIYKFIKLGAKGVQMGTRFVATYECDADDNFKEIILNSKKEAGLKNIKETMKKMKTIILIKNQMFLIFCF